MAMTKRSLHHFAKDAHGAIAPLYALSLFALVGIGGIAFDYGRIAAMDTELQGAADQAALAAATQLSKVAGSKDAAVNAAEEYFASHGYNKTLFANDGDTDATKVGVVTVEFYSNRADAEAETNAFDAASTSSGEEDADANFVRVVVKQRTAEFALTPVVGALRGSLDAAATAGLGSSVCKVPPIMICHPDPNVDIDWTTMQGVGVQATGNANGNQDNGESGGNTRNTWSPGNFGFLEVGNFGTTDNENKALLRSLAYINPPLDCTPVGENTISTGNPQSMYDAINTRFDILDFPINNSPQNVLAACGSGSCPAAQNVITDLVNTNPTGNNGCKIRTGNGNGPGWKLPDAAEAFNPITKSGSTNETIFDGDAITSRMGLPRDNCHYTTYNGTGNCTGGSGRFGDKLWSRADYFKTNHTVSGSVLYPPTLSDGRTWSSYTRYETYLWELDGNLPANTGGRYFSPTNQCATGSDGGVDRRVMTVAVVSNCADLHGASEPVEIDAWVDVFLVEPTIDATVRYNNAKDSIYFEIIGPTKSAGGNSYGVQTVRRDVPYLVR